MCDISVGSMLRGMIVPTYLERFPKSVRNGNNENYLVDFLFNFEEFYFDSYDLFKNDFVTKSIAQYLISSGYLTGE